jgi:hypothetical protein
MEQPKEVNNQQKETTNQESLLRPKAGALYVANPKELANPY